MICSWRSARLTCNHSCYVANCIYGDQRCGLTSLVHLVARTATMKYLLGDMRRHILKRLLACIRVSVLTSPSEYQSNLQQVCRLRPSLSSSLLSRRPISCTELFSFYTGSSARKESPDTLESPLATVQPDDMELETDGRRARIGPQPDLSPAEPVQCLCWIICTDQEPTRPTPAPSVVPAQYLMLSYQSPHCHTRHYFTLRRHSLST